MKVNEDKVVALLYHLMRDHLPTGEIERIVKELEKAGDVKLVFSNHYLEMMARAYLERLR